MGYIHSPLNYTGGKYNLLPQILPLFPKEINTFVDLFAGGLNVAANVQAKHAICNDINNYVIGLYEYFQSVSIDELLDLIHKCIKEYGLDRYNAFGYMQLRNAYNREHDPLLFFMLICYGFNHQIRFNGKHEFNNAYGKFKVKYNPSIEADLIEFHRRIQGFDIRLCNYKDFDYDMLKPGDFLYADPPYLISCAAYNDGKRGFDGWTREDDVRLYQILDQLDSRNVKFALSNVTKHKGMTNDILVEWSSRYNVNYLSKSYANANYQATPSETVEVLVTNYMPERRITGKLF